MYRFDPIAFAPSVERTPWVITGRPVTYEPGVLVPWLRPILSAVGQNQPPRVE